MNAKKKDAEMTRDRTLGKKILVTTQHTIKQHPSAFVGEKTKETALHTHTVNIQHAQHLAYLYYVKVGWMNDQMNSLGFP